PPLPGWAVTDRGFTARGRRGRPRRRRAPAAGGGSRRRRGVPLVAHLRHAAEDEATKAHRLLVSACRRTTCRTRAGQIAQRGGGGAVAAPMRRRGRRPITRLGG